MITAEILARSLANFYCQSGHTHEFIINAMRQRERADNLTICNRKKQIDASFSCVCPIIDNRFQEVLTYSGRAFILVYLIVS